jgi:SOS-response transcriptional repressor LexA/DNA-binding XRE family transcriptional regulator
MESNMSDEPEKAMTFGETIRFLRESNGLTKKDTAGYVRCSPTYIANIEKKNVIPSDDIIIKLANLFKYNKKKLLFLAKRESTVPEAKDLFATQKDIFERELINDYFLTIIHITPDAFSAKDIPLMDKNQKVKLSKKIWEKINYRYSHEAGGTSFIFKEADIKISDYLNGSQKSDGEIINILKKIIDKIEYNIYSEETRVYFKREEKKTLENVEPARLGKMINIPLLTWVQAGGMTEYDDKYPYPGYSDEYISTDLKGEHLFALRVRGDSMSPKFLEDDIVIVNPDAQPENGSYVIVKDIISNETTLKQLKIYSNDLMVLHPLNPLYTDIEFGKNCKIIGKVVRKQTNL